jgi:hypothetical protein
MYGVTARVTSGGVPGVTATNWNPDRPVGPDSAEV